MSINKIKNFPEDWKETPYIYWAMNIGDFKLYKNNKEKIIEDAKVWYSIYGIESLSELANTKKNIIVVIPALTWNARLFAKKASQWEWWANFYWKSWTILDPNKNIIIWLDYFWWPYDSTWPYKHNLNFYPVPAEKQVEAWKKALKLIWIKNIDILLWWSNWWGHIHTWTFDKELEPKYLVPIAGPIAPILEAKENMMNYFKNEGKKFEKRFSLSSLVLLSQAIVDAQRISPEEYVKKISEKINLIIISIEDDNLFETKSMQEYFNKVKLLRKDRWDSWKTKIEILKSWPCTIQAWHDSFLWQKPIEKINKLILRNINND